MQTYIILSRLSPDALKDPKIYREMADKVSNRIKQECPDVHWQKSFAVLGRFDVVDIVESDNPKQGTIPGTGSNTAPLLWGATGMVGFGLLALAATRRRRRLAA